MRVAVVCPYDLDIPGGVQDQTIRLVRWLGTAGIEASLIGPGGDGPRARCYPVRRRCSQSIARWHRCGSIRV